MKTVQKTLMIALGLLVMGSVAATAGTDGAGKTQKGKRTASLKKGEQSQGTFAYRFNTYTQYSSGGEAETCTSASTEPSCAESLNTALRTSAEPYGSVEGVVRKTTPVKKSTNNKASTKSDD